MIFALVYCTVEISGVHINPVVTFGLFLARKLSLPRALLYMICQCLAAFCRAGVVKGFEKHQYEVLGGGANSVAHGLGAKKEFTMIEWHDRANDLDPTGQQLRTYHNASVTILANHFTARNISFKNTAPTPMPGMEGWQAVAFRISGDKAYFLGYGFYGAQDTLCDDSDRHYFKECYIEGSIDFIFCKGRSMYKHCELHSIAQEFGSVAAQDHHLPDEKMKFSFVNCSVTGTGPLYIGRAMGQYSRIVYAYTFFDDIVAREAWDDWDNQTTKERIAFFGVYKCYGPGAPAARGVSWAHELTPQQAWPFLVKSFVNGKHWIQDYEAWIMESIKPRNNVAHLFYLY